MNDGTDTSGRSWSVALVAPPDVAAARRVASIAMTELGASVIRRTKFVTAVSEIARNALVHGGGGVISFTLRGQGRGGRLTEECRDRGPGIPDLEQAMTDGFTSGGGLGHGLGGARRLVDDFTITSNADGGTTVRLMSVEQ